MKANELRIGSYWGYPVRANGVIFSKRSGKPMKPQDNGKGYKKITLTIKGKQIQKYVHRIIAELFCENPNNYNQVNHKDGNKANNNYLNLEWCNNSINQIHAHQSGLKSNGNDLWNGRFSKEDIEYIFDLNKEGKKQIWIANHMNCSKSTISEILSGKRYKTYTSL